MNTFVPPSSRVNSQFNKSAVWVSGGIGSSVTVILNPSFAETPPAATAATKPTQIVSSAVRRNIETLLLRCPVFRRDTDTPTGCPLKLPQEGHLVLEADVQF